MSKTLTINGHLVRSAVLIPGGDVKAIGDGTQTLWEATTPDYFFIENYTQSANTVAFPKTGSAEEWVSLDYSLDGRTWYPYDLETGVSIPAGGKLYLKGDNANLSKSVSGAWTTHSFTSTGAILAGGNALSLLDSTVPATKTVSGGYGFSCVFMGNTNLLSTDSALFDGVDIGNSYAFYRAFDGCTNLTNVPAFGGVTNVTQSSFTQTFRNCTSITTAAGFLPNAVSTTSALVFQGCFYGCTSLVTPPDLSAIVPGAGNSVFIEMFRGCISLATPAEVYSPVPNVTGTHKLAGMYNGCTSLTRSPRVYIPNPTANILLNTFTGCGSLDLIRVTFDSWGTDGEYTNEWTYGVHSTGVFCKTSSLPVTRNARDAAQSACDYIPYLWSIADQNGKLYAPVITESNGMVSIAEAEGGQSCTIYYTTDGADPDPNASVYTQPFAAVPGQTVKAISVYGGTSAAYVIHSDIESYTVVDYFSMTDVSGSSNTLTLTKLSDGSAPAVSLEYSTDKISWTAWSEENGARTLSIPAGGTVYLRGSNPSGFAVNDTNCHVFSSTGVISAGGDMMYLLNTSGGSSVPANGFRMLFSGMTTLRGTPKLTASIVATGGCRSMFQGCTGITSAAGIHLDDTAPGSYAYYYMFNGCSSLATPPAFTSSPVTLAGFAMSAMFRGTALVTAPAVNIAATGQQSLDSVFRECTSLTDASAFGINAATLQKRTCYTMFNGCSGLAAAPEIMAATLYSESGNGSLAGIFNGCAGLPLVKTHFTSWDANMTQNWLNSVAASGVLCMTAASAAAVTMGNAGGCPSGWSLADENGKLYAPSFSYDEQNGTIAISEYRGGGACTIYYTADGTTPTPQTGTAYTGAFAVTPGQTVKAISHYGGASSAYVTGSDVVSYEVPAPALADYFYIENLSDSPNTVTMPGNYTVSLQKSSNPGSAVWDTFNPSTGVTLAAGERVYLKGVNSSLATSQYWRSFASTGDACIGGSLCTLLFGDSDTGTVSGAYALNRLFMGWTHLKSISSNLFSGLTISSNSSYILSRLFLDCTSLTDASRLAIRVDGISASSAEYAMMFSGCSSLVSPPSITVVHPHDYMFREMFKNCTSLAAAPSFTVGEDGYGTRTSCCASMFEGCTNLTTAGGITLNLTTLGTETYRAMFKDCTSLSTPPLFTSSALTVRTSGMNSMFQGCTSLVTAPSFTVSAFSDSSNYMYNVRNMFNGCTSLADASGITISVNKLCEQSCDYMFYGCTSLVKPPVVEGPITSGSSSRPLIFGNAIAYMFNGCTSLDLIKLRLAGLDNYYSNAWTYNVHSTGVFCRSILPVTRNASGAAEADCDYIPYLWSTADYNGVLDAPSISGTYDAVAIAEANDGQSCELYYTTDGTTPTPLTGTLYTGAFTVEAGTTVKAIAHYAGTSASMITDSSVVSLTF